ncbi:MAG: prepilin-type N-terminal cleavage/methylation domain-containing protein [Verrucomicrobiales bacterium]
MTVPRQDSQKGWTFVEMLIAVSLSAIFMGAASLVYSSISANSQRLTTLTEVEIGSTTKKNFYDQSGDSVRVYTAPNYGKAALAQEFRDLLLDDASRSSAVFCLPRQLDNSIRPEFLRYVAGDDGSTLPRPRLDTPEAFRRFLADVEPTSAAIYDSAIRNVPDTDRPNLSIYMLEPETDRGYIRVRSLFEIDLLAPGNVDGTYASVRRYRNGLLTHYYDVHYEAGAGDAFQPLFVVFEQSSRGAVNEGPAIDRFKLAEGNPFYLVWLPDPAVNPFQAGSPTASDPATSPRAAYEHMTGKTSFTVALPMFPNL